MYAQVYIIFAFIKSPTSNFYFNYRDLVPDKSGGYVTWLKIVKAVVLFSSTVNWRHYIKCPPITYLQQLANKLSSLILPCKIDTAKDVTNFEYYSV